VICASKLSDVHTQETWGNNVTSPRKIHIYLVRSEVFTAVTIKNAVFWDVMPHGSCRTRCFGEGIASIIGVTRIGELGSTLAV
jgi:hypothetical protein